MVHYLIEFEEPLILPRAQPPRAFLPAEATKSAALWRMRASVACRRFCHGFLSYLPYTGLWLAENDGMEKKMETTIMGYMGVEEEWKRKMEKSMESHIMGYIRTTIRIHSFIANQRPVY